MNLLSSYIFWTGIAVIGYTYLGYGVVIYLLTKLKNRTKSTEVRSDMDLPAITFLIAAHNEENFIQDKINNTLALDYPADKLLISVINDGSTDRTLQIVQQYPQIRIFHEPVRKGKIHGVNNAMKQITTEIVVFCDANTQLNSEALKKIVRHYRDEKVGGVAGEKKIFKKKQDNASGAGEGLYWKYESFLKRKDSELYSVVGADGGLFSMRTKLYEQTPENMIIEDFYISLRIAMRGYRFIYEPEACATETASASAREEWKRKVRISAGGFQAMLLLLPLLNIFRYGILSFQYFSHRVLRWTLAPLFLPLILVSNFLLAVQGDAAYLFILTCQLGFYFIAIAGYFLQDRKIAIKGFFVPFYFSFMNLAVYAGLNRFLKGRQSVMWEKAARADTR